MIGKALLFILWVFVWCLLSWPPDIKNVVVGIFVSIFVTFMMIDTFRSPGAVMEGETKWPGPAAMVKKVLWFICYVGVFLWECLKANLDVAWRVVCPTLPIRPATIKVRTGLKTDIGLTFLANSITLTPGRTTVDIDKEGGYIYIHLLYLKENYKIEEMTLPVVTKYERILKRVFE